jgi:hypothetical protein
MNRSDLVREEGFDVKDVPTQQTESSMHGARVRGQSGIDTVVFMTVVKHDLQHCFLDTCIGF